MQTEQRETPGLKERGLRGDLGAFVKYLRMSEVGYPPTEWEKGWRTAIEMVCDGLELILRERS